MSGLTSRQIAFVRRTERTAVRPRSGHINRSERTATTADQAPRRVTGSADVPRIFVTCKTPRNVAVDFALVGLSVGRSIHQEHTKKKDQIEHRKHEQATSRPPFLVIAPTYLP